MDMDLSFIYNFVIVIRFSQKVHEKASDICVKRFVGKIIAESYKSQYLCVVLKPFYSD